jgi:hypothetical protein
MATVGRTPPFCSLVQIGAYGYVRDSIAIGEEEMTRMGRTSAAVAVLSLLAAACAGTQPKDVPTNPPPSTTSTVPRAPANAAPDPHSQP